VLLLLRLLQAARQRLRLAAARRLQLLLQLRRLLQRAGGGARVCLLLRLQLCGGGRQRGAPGASGAAAQLPSSPAASPWRRPALPEGGRPSPPCTEATSACSSPMSASFSAMDDVLLE
jgi:hypothetical protein